MKYKKIAPKPDQIASSVIASTTPVLVHPDTFYPLPDRPPDEQREDILFCQCCYGEARGESPEGIKAVAEVVMNRWLRREGYWGFSVRDVILDHNKNGVYEFSCMDPDSPTYAALSKPYWPDWAKVFKASLPIFLDAPKLSPDSAFFYCTETVAENRFFQSLRRLKTIGGHVFFTDMI